MKHLVFRAVSLDNVKVLELTNVAMLMLILILLLLMMLNLALILTQILVLTLVSRFSPPTHPFVTVKDVGWRRLW